MDKEYLVKVDEALMSVYPYGVYYGDIKVLSLPTQDKANEAAQALTEAHMRGKNGDNDNSIVYPGITTPLHYEDKIKEIVGYPISTVRGSIDE